MLLMICIEEIGSRFCPIGGTSGSVSPVKTGMAGQSSL
jgi:hypothetical protein